MIELEQYQDRVILVGLCQSSEEAELTSLDELRELAKTAGAEVITQIMQRRSRPDPATYIGSGKIEELRELMESLSANGIICDDELSPAQMKNLQDQLGCKIMDRTLLILDIFAGRATTSEGKIQVELAQLKYRQMRLIGMGRSMSRLGGGIGTRGPGEKKLETDRRLISERIGILNRELKEVRKHRDVIREGRKRGSLKTAAIVGYTNAGKSTLLNHLTDADVLEEDALFATLDPTTRLLPLPGGSSILVTDTVGFIRKLPHQLIEAFKSTLEEAMYADIIIHVADASNPNVDEQMAVVYETLHELKADGKPTVTLFNKQDLIEPGRTVHLRDAHADYTINTAVRSGVGLERLKEVLEEIIRRDQILIERVFPYSEAGKTALIRDQGQLLEEEYTEGGIRIRAYVPRELYGRL
jgi:GTP-binding protein HflX